MKKSTNMVAFVFGAALLCSLLGSGVDAFTPECPELQTLESGISYLTETMVKKTLPAWLESVDEDNGGYALGETTDGPKPIDTKTLMSQTRLLWTFSYAHNAGYSKRKRSYLKAAESGYNFLQEKFLDQEHGGYLWSTDDEGNPIDEGKFLRGQCHVILALCEYFKATNDEGALSAALDVFEAISTKARDNEDTFGGFFEDMTRNWTVAEVDGNLGSGPIGTKGLKSFIGVMHLVEAYTALAITSKDPQVEAALEELLDEILIDYYPDNPAEIIGKRQYSGMQWSGIPYDEYAGVIAMARAVLEAEEALGRDINWKAFDRYTKYAIKNGIDKSSQGIQSNGELVWWAQVGFMEMAGISKLHRPKKSLYDKHLKGVIQFFACNMLDSEDGIPVWSVHSNGTVNRNEKRGNWKSAYLFVEGVGALQSYDFS